MNSRERFKQTLLFGKPDHIPLCEFIGFWDETILRWLKEGLPELPLRLYRELRPSTQEYLSVLAYEYFSLEDMGEVVRINTGPIPGFVSKTLEETDRHIVRVGSSGGISKWLKTKISMPTWIEYPVKTYEDFVKMKRRFDPKDIRRYPGSWSSELMEHYNSLTCPVGVIITGFFGQARAFMGTEKLLIAFYKNPKLVHEIMEFWSNFLIETYRDLFEQVKVDYVYLWEDMAHKSGPMASPKLFKEFMLPHYKELTNFLHKNKVDIVMLDSDGNIEALIPLLIEGGINCLLPLEAAADMDAVDLRKQYGKKVSFIGNIDKRVLSQGIQAIKKEVDYKLSIIDEGGYIPCVDHLVTYDISFENYTYYIKLLKEKLYATK